MGMYSMRLRTAFNIFIQADQIHYENASGQLSCDGKSPPSRVIAVIARHRETSSSSFVQAASLQTKSVGQPITAMPRDHARCRRFFTAFPPALSHAPPL